MAAICWLETDSDARWANAKRGLMNATEAETIIKKHQGRLEIPAQISHYRKLAVSCLFRHHDTIVHLHLPYICHFISGAAN